MKSRALSSVLLFTASCAHVDPWREDFEALEGSHSPDREREFRLGVLRELEETEVSWAGDYSLGFGERLILAPSVGFSHQPFPGWDDGCHGAVRIDERGRVHLDPAEPRVSELFRLDLEYQHVAWNGRRYLVPTDGWLAFCNGVNQGRAHSSVFSLIDERVPRTDEGPPVPPEFQRYLLDEPVHAKVRRAKRSRGARRQTLYQVWLDRGSSDGLLRGMEVIAHDPDARTVFMIEEAWADGCRARSTGHVAHPERPRAGDLVWTGSRRR